MPTKLVKITHADPNINRIQRHVEDAFSSLHLAVSSASLYASVSSSLDNRFNSRYLLTSSASPQTVTSSLAISGTVAITGALNVTSNIVVQGNTNVSGNLTVTGSAASRRLGVGMLADANIPLCVSSSNFTSIYVTTSGTRAVLEMDSLAGNQSAIQFDEAGAQKFLLGKQTDNTFILFDAVGNRNPYAYAPSTNITTLHGAGGKVGVGTGAPAVNLEVSSGSANGSVSIRITNTSSVTSSATLNLYSGIRKWSISSDQNGNLAFNDDTSGGNRGYWTTGGDLNVVNNAYVGSKLGIGTSSPSYQLHVLGGDAQVSHGVNNGNAMLSVFNSSSVSSSAVIDLNTGIRDWQIYNNPVGYFGVYDNTAGFYRLKIDQNGNVGIGSNNPSVKLHVQGDTWVDNGILAVSASSPYIAIKSTAAAASFPTVYLQLSSALADYRIYNNSSAEFAVYDNAAGAYRFKIDSTGKVGINQTPSVDQLCINGIVRSLGYRCLQGTGGGSYGNVFNSYWTGAALQAWVDNTNVGTFSLTCDRRLKHLVRPLSGSALASIGKLNPVIFRWQDKDIWKDDGNDHLGFLADELQAVIPTAVNGDVSGSQYQNLNIVDLVAVQTKAIQELKTIVELQQLQIRALQAKNP